MLRAFPVPETIAFFREIGVHVHEEADGKLFPDSNRARDVLDALLRSNGARRRDAAHGSAGARHRRRPTTAFSVTTSGGSLHARAVVLATGGQSLPKSGSDGTGFTLARRLGHTIVPPTPALVPLVLRRQSSCRACRESRRIVELTIWIDGAVATRLKGALLWTHVGVSGPVAMNASRHWLRAQLEGTDPVDHDQFFPGASFDDVDRRWTALSSERPAASLQHALATMVPASVAAALVAHLVLTAPDQLAHLTREDRRRLVHALVAWPLPSPARAGTTTLKPRPAASR